MASKILIADDVDSWQQIIVSALREYCEDVELIVVSTREEALAAIANRAGLKIVVTDLRMPNRGDGEAIVTAAQQKGIQVIVLSGTINDLNQTVRDNCLAVFKKWEYEGEALGEAVNRGLNS